MNDPDRKKRCMKAHVEYLTCLFEVIKGKQGDELEAALEAMTPTQQHFQNFFQGVALMWQVGSYGVWGHALRYVVNKLEAGLLGERDAIDVLAEKFDELEGRERKDDYEEKVQRKLFKRGALDWNSLVEDNAAMFQKFEEIFDSYLNDGETREDDQAQKRWYDDMRFDLEHVLFEEPSDAQFRVFNDNPRDLNEGHSAVVYNAEELLRDLVNFIRDTKVFAGLIDVTKHQDVDSQWILVLTGTILNVLGANLLGIDRRMFILFVAASFKINHL